MDGIYNTAQGILSFVLVISAVVFVHEFGHYYFARLFGVQVDQFSIGFGKAVFSWLDKNGTNWKVCCIPLGGYIKMYGDANAASAPDDEMLDSIPLEKRVVSFHHKPLWQKATIIAAGPIFNYLLAILIITGAIYHYGLAFAKPEISEVMANSPAMVAGLRQGDEITSINGDKVDNFISLKSYMAAELGQPLNLQIKRGNEEFVAVVKPQPQEIDDGFGQKMTTFTIGIIARNIAIKHLDLTESFKQAFVQVYEMSSVMLRGIKQIISGERSGSELGGPIKIAQVSAKTSEYGFHAMLMFIAMISVNLGMVNLFPIPLLDGGHLMFYAIEGMLRKPLRKEVMSCFYKLGFFALISLMFYATSNDIRNLYRTFF